MRTSAFASSLALLLCAAEARADALPKPEIARGKFLVASDRLVDPNFQQTVVLLLEYEAAGALGVVINRPTGVKLAALLPELEELRGRPDIVFLGGPVARDRMILLVRASQPPDESARVLDGVFITSSLDVLRDLSRETGGAERYRTYVGYAGWGPMQLDAEIERGDWHVTPAEPATLFAKDPSAVWPELNERASGQWVRAPAFGWATIAAAAAQPPARPLRVSARSVASPFRPRRGTPGAHLRSL